MLEQDHTLIILSVIKNNRKRLGAFGIDFDEAYSAALVGLAKAINDYDDSPCLVGFYKFAYKIIWNSIFNEERGSSKRKNLIHSSLLRIQDKYLQRTGRSLSVEKLAALLDVDDKLIRDHLRSTLSFEQYLKSNKNKTNDSSANTFSSTVKDSVFLNKNAPLPEEAGSLDEEYFVATINEILNDKTYFAGSNALNNLERQTIRLYFGIGLSERMTIGEMTKFFHAAQKTVSGYLKSGLEKLRSNKRLQKLYVEA